MKLECGVSAEWPIWSKTCWPKSVGPPSTHLGLAGSGWPVRGLRGRLAPAPRVRVPSLGCASPQLTLTSIWRGCAFSSFGRTTLSTPSLVSARMAELSTLSGRSKERWNLPALRYYDEEMIKSRRVIPGQERVTE